MLISSLLLALAQAAPADLPPGDGPRGTSGEHRYDTVGYAGAVDTGNPAAVSLAAVSVVSDAVPAGSFVELTALDTGHTIVASVSGRGVAGGNVVDLSPGAARQLGVSGSRVAIRVRTVTPIAQDQGALQRGGAAPPRMDAPQSLLVALRQRLPGGGAVAAPPHVAAVQPARTAAIASRPARPGAAYPPPAAPAAVRTPPASPPEKASPPRREAATGPGWYIQVAALSSLDRAQALVSSLGGGRVVSAGNLHRVQIGPYPSTAAAQHARDGIARRGYGGAAIIRGQ